MTAGGLKKIEMKKESGLFCHLVVHKDRLDLKKEIDFIFSLKILHDQSRF